ncbi:MAG: alpha-2-macroglobulin family protein [Pyrinomonadaceae bacterium]
MEIYAKRVVTPRAKGMGISTIMKKLTSLVLLFAVYSSIFSPLLPAVNGQIRKGIRTNNTMIDQDAGLKFRLSEGVEGAKTRESKALAATDPLSNDDASRLLGRLPAIKMETDDQTDFVKRAGSLPAPKARKQISVKFPSDEARSAPTLGPAGKSLEVIRYSPEGAVSLAPDLSVSFSLPMVSVTSQDEAGKVQPVELSPQVEGNWRWLGTKTLMFDTTSRFPMATRFTVRVPAGTKSATGESLPKDFNWSFTTPPPTVEQMIPSGQTVRRNALMFVRFDQAIDPAAVLRSISVKAADKAIPIRLATQAEIDSDTSIGYYVKEAQPNRWLVFRAVDSDGQTENALPAASQITVTVEKGTPSAEGPMKSEKAQSFTFQTYGAFKFKSGYCGWRQNKACSPSEAWVMEFNNSIDGGAFTREMIKIEPSVEGLNVFPSGSNLYIQGYKKGRTKYKITVDGSLKDTFGQTMGTPAVATIDVGRANPSLFAQGGPMVVLDPAANQAFSIYSTNHGSVKVKLYSVDPGDWQQYQNYYRRLNYDDGKRPSIPGRLVSDKVVPIENVSDEMIETRIGLSDALKGGFGHAILDIEPIVRRDKNDRTRIFTWVQSTQLGLDAFVDNTELVGFATELKTGKPLSGVELSIFPNGTTSSAVDPGVTVTEEPGILDRAWSWLTGDSGVHGPAIESLDANGGELDSEAVGEAQTNRTAANGIQRIALPVNQTATNGMNILVAKRGNDVAFLPENSDYYWQEAGGWYRKTQGESLQWFVFDDRGMYRPNEEVAVKGYLRKLTTGKFGDIEGLGDAASGITYSVKDARDNEIAKGSGSLNAFGAFDLKFKLPDNANLGYWRIDLTTKTKLFGGSHSHSFQVQEFRRPEFEVIAKVASEAPHLVGGNADLIVEAKYYAGGGLVNAETNWTVTAAPTNYTPPNRDDFTFGTWVPWWRIYDYADGGMMGRGRPGGGITQTFKGVTDSSGKHHLKIDFESVDPPRPYSIRASAAVQDVNRQTWSGSANLLVHPSTLYVGIKTPRTFVQKRESILIESIVTDIDGKLIGGRDVEIRAVLKDWQFEKGKWEEKVVDEQICAAKSAETAQKCTFTAKEGGRYTITARVMDDRERFNESEFTVWVPGGKTPPKRNVEQEEVQIIPSKKDYSPGDVAELLVIAPFTPAEGVLTLRREGIVKVERFTMKDSSVTLKIPLEDKYLPNIYAQVDLVGAAPRTDARGEVDAKLPKRPAFASGNINLPISTASRRLTVTAEPRDKTLAPGGNTTVAIEVKDNTGRPVEGSEIAVVIVDESVLALTGYSISDPLGVFYTDRPSGTQDFHSRKDVLLGNPDDAKASPTPSNEAVVDVSANAVGGFETLPTMARSPVLKMEPSARAPVQPIDLRENFEALAVFAPSVRTDSNGRAAVDVKLPDNLTRYRVTAVSVDQGKRFGKTESAITAKKPLMVRPSAPRFLNFGDKVDLPIVVQNQTDADLAVDVAVRAANALLTGGDSTGSEGVSSGKRVIVKANSREEVRFPVSTVKAGTARFQIAVSSGSYSDAAEISLPVWTPATTEAFATYGTTDQNGAIIQPVLLPGDVYPQFGGLEITTSSTQLQELTDSFIQLYRYPFECTEQIASRMISIAALKDVLSAFKANDMPTEAELNATFEKDIQILKSRQRDDGSFGMWQLARERYEYPFLTVHTAHALQLAKEKGFKVPPDMLNKTVPYLKDVEKHFNDEWHRSSPQARWTISAYALYVRDRMGDKDTAKTKKLLAEATVEKMPFEALGWVLSVIANDPGSTAEADVIKRFLMNRTTETAAAANFVTDYSDGEWLVMHSNRRADGVLLEALIKSDPANDLVPKLVRGLLDHRRKGHWGSTQENVFILLALDKYFNAFEKVTPDFVTRVWLGNTYTGEQKFKGRSVDSNLLNIPMSYLVDQGAASNLILDKQGAGRLYYRIGMKYAPKNLKLEPADYGFTVLRSYEAIDKAEDVKQNSDGSWTISSGARVRVRLTMVAQARRYHVALVDPLPAGLEILNPGLAVTEAIPADTGGTKPNSEKGYSYWWRRNWFEHQNFRDERAEAFSSLLWEGVYNYSYVARATTPGEFVVPPAKAEEMYHPETFGRSGTDFVRVE